MLMARDVARAHILARPLARKRFSAQAGLF
jgi:hypothetical protein